MTPTGSRWAKFGRPPLAGIAAIRRIGCLAGQYLGARQRSRSRRARTATRVSRLDGLDPARSLSATRPDARVLLSTLVERGHKLGQNLYYDARASSGDNLKLPDLLSDPVR